MNTSTAPRRILALCLTDVEQSSQHWRAHASSMTPALAHLDAAVDDAARCHDGHVVKSRGEGDSHFVVFDTASAAVAFAARLQTRLAQAWPGEVCLAVRAALHAGEVEARGDDYLGIAINQAARLRSVAHGGQIVASRTVVDLAAGTLDGDLRFEHLGRHRIRDLDGWTDVFQVCGPRLADRFPPLVTIDQGLPPLATILFLDVVGALGATQELSAARKERLMVGLAGLIATSFATAGGQYLKQFGDGCLALFDDPDAAIAFARTIRDGLTRHGYDLRGGLHVGRVRFGSGEPVGQSILEASALMRGTAAGLIGLSPAASALLDAPDGLLPL